jgi:hypothetical protein
LEKSIISEASQISLIYEDCRFLVRDILVVWQQFTHVSKENSASICGVRSKPSKQKASCKQQDYFIRNVGKQLSDYTEFHSKR